VVDVGELGFAPTLKLLRQLAVAVVEERPVEEVAVARPSVMLNLFQHPVLRLPSACPPGP
jgi:hypothetical protein